MKNICIFVDFVIFNEEEEVDILVILRILMRELDVFVEKTYQTHIIIPSRVFLYILKHNWRGSLRYD